MIMCQIRNSWEHVWHLASFRCQERAEESRRVCVVRPLSTDMCPLSRALRRRRQNHLIVVVSF
jgi:hypothetical protein